MNDIKAYQEMVDQAAESSSSQVLPNAGETHAAIVMAKMFEKTKSAVNMIVGSLQGNVSDQLNYLEQLEGCINKRIPFNIVFLNSPNKDSKAYNLLLKKKNEGFPIQMVQASMEMHDRFYKNQKPIHFSVFDEDKYRFEKDPNKFLAWFCFNGPEIAEKLNRLFEEVFSKSQKISTLLHE